MENQANAEKKSRERMIKLGSQIAKGTMDFGDKLKLAIENKLLGSPEWKSISGNIQDIADWLLNNAPGYFENILYVINRIARLFGKEEKDPVVQKTAEIIRKGNENMKQIVRVSGITGAGGAFKAAISGMQARGELGMTTKRLAAVSPEFAGASTGERSQLLRNLAAAGIDAKARGTIYTKA